MDSNRTNVYLQELRWIYRPYFIQPKLNCTNKIMRWIRNWVYWTKEWKWKNKLLAKITIFGCNYMLFLGNYKFGSCIYQDSNPLNQTTYSNNGTHHSLTVMVFSNKLSTFNKHFRVSEHLPKQFHPSADVYDVISKLC